jgi:Di-haem oxidoreductase, putative peroxidase
MFRKGISNQKSLISACATITILTPFCWTLTRSGAAEQTGRRHSAYGDRQGVLHARIIATGIPGAGAVAEVGDFLRGSPMHDNALFVPYTQAGMVLDPKRVLVASSSNFGAPLARVNDPEGSILSIDPAADGLAVPTDFAAAGGQASVFDGAVQVYAAQSPSFLNSLTEPQAVTSDLPSASLPLGISLNNGNGRPWLANAPNDAKGIGTITVLDPQGFPLAGAPDTVAGGVFAGDMTNRSATSTHGLTSAALGTAIVTKSPDLTGRAVFAAVEADGSVVQIHVAKGVDGLAPPGTVTPIAKVDRATAESTDPRAIAREGIVFNWVPTRNLFIADPQANRLVVLNLADDNTIFSAIAREIRADEFNLPIDLAPTTREISSGSFASNTTLGGGSDLYVLNRGNNTIVRMSIDGDVRGTRIIEADMADFRANGIAISSDGQTIYVTATAPKGGGVLMAVPAFGGTTATSGFFAQAQDAGQADDMTSFGKFFFSLTVTPQQGLGPLFNGQSCAECHSSPFPGGMALLPGKDVRRVGSLRDDGTFDQLLGRGGPVARMHSVTEMGGTCDLAAGIPPQADVVSQRNAMTLRGNGLLDTVALGDVLANMASEPPAVRGRPNVLTDGRLGKFGWKADVATLVEFMGIALRNELGLTNPLEPRDEVWGCEANRNSPEVDALTLQATAKFLNTLDPPAPAATCTSSTGAAVFQSAGCAGCHTPSLPGPGARQLIQLYSDLLLHDMGPGLADQMRQGSALGIEWRTPPLWKVSERGKFLHDGRATTMTDAILAHGGQGQAARDAFVVLDSASKQALLAFLGCI